MSITHDASKWNRTRKWDQFNRTFPLHPDTRILDAGFSEVEYEEWGLADTTNWLEKNYPYLDQVTALSVELDEAKHYDLDTLRLAEERALIPTRYPGLNFVVYPGGRMPFEDGEFDVVWSNAVVEHVGQSVAQIEYLAECRRVAKHGFITTPNRYFPVELHTRTRFHHWLPKDRFDRFLTKRGQEWATGNYMNLVSRSQFMGLLAAAGIVGYELHTNRVGPFGVDFVASW